MKSVAKLIGGVFLVLWMLTSLLLFFYYWQQLMTWLGGVLGSIIAFAVAPGFLIFPIVFWLVQGVFPVFYFELLGVIVALALISGFFFMLGGSES